MDAEQASQSQSSRSAVRCCILAGASDKTSEVLNIWYTSDLRGFQIRSFTEQEAFTSDLRGFQIRSFTEQEALQNLGGL